MNQQQKHIHEIQIVRELGERIGYGNILSIAAALWTMKLREDGIKRTPPRVVTLVTALNSRDRNDAVREIENKITFIQENVPQRKSYEQQLENILRGMNEIAVKEQI